MLTDDHRLSKPNHGNSNSVSGVSSGCTLAKSLQLRPYFTLYPSSPPHTDTVRGCTVDYHGTAQTLETIYNSVKGSSQIRPSQDKVHSQGRSCRPGDLVTLTILLQPEMEVATTERHWNDTSVQQFDGLEVVLLLHLLCHLVLLRGGFMTMPSGRSPAP